MALYFQVALDFQREGPTLMHYWSLDDCYEKHNYEDITPIEPMEDNERLDREKTNAAAPQRPLQRSLGSTSDACG